MRSQFRVGPWVVEPSLNSISQPGNTKHLEPKVMEVLVELARRAGNVVPKEDLISLVWPDTFVGDDALLRCISELRRALEDDPKEPRYIQTIPKRGYRLIAEVSESMPEAESGGAQPAAAPARRSRWIPVAGFAALAALLAAGYFVAKRYWQEPAGTGRRIMLAVLPFKNLSADPQQEYFSEGLTEEMITQLASLQPERLGVIARTSAMHYKDTGKSIQQIGRELGVDYIVEGAVRREGERLRITAQLIHVGNQAHIWAESYERELSGVLAVQAGVARAVAGHIRLTLASTKSTELAASRAVNAEAYLAYLMGNYHRHKLTPEGFQTAIGHFQRAVELDPGFARAWLGLSDSYRMLGSWWGDMPPRKAFPIAEEALRQALNLDAALGEAHGSLGWIYFVYHWDWAKAEEEFKRGVELSPNARDALSPYANFLRRMNRLEEGRRVIERCIELDPLSPLEVTEAARLYLDLGETKKAGPVFQRVSETDPDSRASLLGMSQFYSRTGEWEKAIQLMERAVRIWPRDRLILPSLGMAYAQTGRHADARAVLQSLLTTPEIGQGAIAELYARLGEKEEAIRWWQKAYDEQDPRMVWLRLYSSDHPLWGDPRFQELIRRMNFPR